jgi:hypothetical protein
MFNELGYLINANHHGKFLAIAVLLSVVLSNNIYKKQHK